MNDEDLLAARHTAFLLGGVPAAAMLFEPGEVGRCFACDDTGCFLCAGTRWVRRTAVAAHAAGLWDYLLLFDPGAQGKGA